MKFYSDFAPFSTHRYARLYGGKKSPSQPASRGDCGIDKRRAFRLGEEHRRSSELQELLFCAACTGRLSCETVFAGR